MLGYNVLNFIKSINNSLQRHVVIKRGIIMTFYADILQSFVKYISDIFHRATPPTATANATSIMTSQRS